MKVSLFNSISHTYYSLEAEGWIGQPLGHLCPENIHQLQLGLNLRTPWLSRPARYHRSLWYIDMIELEFTQIINKLLYILSKQQVQLIRKTDWKD